MLAVIPDRSTAHMDARKTGAHRRCCSSGTQPTSGEKGTGGLTIQPSLSQMLPFGGQGSNQAIEDGGAIGFLLVNVDNEAQLPRRLQLFDQLRRRRASRIQILSSVRANRETVVEDKIKQFMEDGVICELAASMSFHSWLILVVPNSFATRVAHDAG